MFLFFIDKYNQFVEIESKQVGMVEDVGERVSDQERYENKLETDEWRNNSCRETENKISDEAARRSD